MRTKARWTRQALCVSLILGGSILFTGASAASSARARTSLLNVRVSHDNYPAHVEPALAVNPRNPRNLLGVAQLIVPGRADTLGTFASFDGGRNWHDNGPLRLPSGTGSGTDVTVGFDARGIGFVAASASGGSGDSGRGVYVWRTDDGGPTFRRSVAVMRGHYADHPWLAVDPSVSGAGALYVAWGSPDGLTFSRSLDGGRTFSRPRLVNGGGDAEVPVIGAGPRGAVYAAFETGGGGGTVHIEVVASHDRGSHFGPPVTLASVPAELAAGPGLHLPTGPAIGADPNGGTVYVAYAAHLSGSAPSDILVNRSPNGGRTWKRPVRVTHERPSTGQYFFQPQLAVDEAGAVDVSYFELNRGQVDLYLERSAVPSSDFVFGPAQRVTNHSFNPALGLKGSKHGRWWIGDYQGLAAGGGAIHPLWNDTRTGHLEIFTASLAATVGR